MQTQLMPTTNPTVDRNDYLFAPFCDALNDIYDAEKQLVRAIPKLINAATLRELRTALIEHLRETEGHVSRLEQVFSELCESSKDQTSLVMNALLAECAKVTDHKDDRSRDAAIIGAAQKIEHYEIAAYGTLRAWAAAMAQEAIAELLDKSLEEEKAADKKLTEFAGKETPHAVEY